MPALNLVNGSTVNGGRYKIVSQIKIGGFGAVYRVQDTQLPKKPLVLKIIPVSHLPPPDQPQVIQMIGQEVDVMCTLRHQAVPGITHYFQEGLDYCLVMDFIEGQNLEDAFLVLQAQKLMMSVQDVLEIAAQLCDVLEYLHNQKPAAVLYRDMKPANVMQMSDGRLVLVDFGLAGWVRLAQGQGQDTAPLGSPGFAAPEQYAPRVPTDVRTDVYGLCATLHRLLTGVDPTDRPMMFEPIRKYRPDVTSELEAVIMQGLAGDKDDRFPSVAALRQALDNAGILPPGYFKRVYSSNGKTTKLPTFLPDQALLGMLGKIRLPSERRYFGDYWNGITYDPVHTNILPLGVDLPRQRRLEAFARLENYIKSGLLPEALAEGERLTREILKCRRADERQWRDEYCFVMGKLREANGEPKKAEWWMRKAISFNPKQTEAYQVLASVQHQQRRTQALQALRRHQLFGAFRRAIWAIPLALVTSLWANTLGKLPRGGWSQAKELLWGDRPLLFHGSLGAGLLAGVWRQWGVAGFDPTGFIGAILATVLLWLAVAMVRYVIAEYEDQGCWTDDCKATSIVAVVALALGCLLYLANGAWAFNDRHGDSYLVARTETQASATPTESPASTSANPQLPQSPTSLPKASGSPLPVSTTSPAPDQPEASPSPSR